MNPDEIKSQLEMMMERIQHIEGRNKAKDQQQISLPLDDVSKRILGELIPSFIYGNGTFVAGQLDINEPRIKSTSTFIVNYRDTSQDKGLAGKYLSATKGRFYSTDNTDTRTINYLIIF